MSPFTISIPDSFNHLKQRAWMLFGMLLTLLLPIGETQACGWYEPDPGSYYVFYAPEAYQFQNLQAFHFTYDRLYDYSLLDTKVSEDANLEAWGKQIWPGSTLTTERAGELRKLIYETRTEDLRVLMEHIQGKGAAPYPARTWTVTKALKDAGKRAEVEYLMMAKEIEPFVGGWSEWEERPEYNLSEVKSLSAKCFQAMSQTSNNFLKVRYGYQGVRLLHRNGLFPEAVEAWEKYMAALKSDELTWWWSLSDFAGALRNTGRKAEAAYQFSRVFDQCPSRRIQAWYSWRVEDESTWQQALGLCKGPEETAAMLFMRNATPSAVVWEDLEQMLKVNPNTPYAQLLVVREVNKLENQILGHHLRHEQPFYLGFTQPEWVDDYGNPDRLNQLQRLVRSAQANASITDHDFWNITQAYLSFLEGRFEAANESLANLMPKLQPESKAKAAVVQMAIRICSTRKADAESEQRLLQEVEALRPKVDALIGERLQYLLDEGLALLYKQQGENAKSMLAINQPYRLWDKGTLAEVDDMIAFVNRPKRSKYEEMLEKRLGEDPMLMLQELRGTRLLGEDRFEEAIPVFEALPENYRKSSETFSLEDNPFRPAILDVINCDGRFCEEGSFDKLSFAKRVVELRKQTLSADKKTLSGIYMQLGHAFYNTSFYGPAWGAMDYQRRDAWYTYGYYDEVGKEQQPDLDEVRDRKLMQLASQYYQWATENAVGKEQMAEGLFHLAKAEQNVGYMDGLSWLDQKRPSFDKLIFNCRGTNYFRRVVKECKYLNFYVYR